MSSYIMTIVEITFVKIDLEWHSHFSLVCILHKMKLVEKKIVDFQLI